MQKKNIEISSEKQAFELIQMALKKQVGDDINITFKNWPILTIELEGDGYAGTITPSIMKSLVEFQDGLNRTYAKVVYDENTSARLKLSEKKELEFKAQVKNKCSLLNVDLTEFAQKVTTELMTKMEPTHIVLLGVASVAIWVGGSVIKKHMELASKSKDISEEAKKSVSLSQEETKRVEIITAAMKAQPQLNQISKEAYAAQVGILKGVSDADTIEINGVKFTREEAKSIARSPRSESEEIQLNGNYHILSVDTSSPDEVKLRLLHLDSQREFNAKFKDKSFNQGQIKLLQDAEWKRPKGKVYLSVNATELRGEITTATVISVTDQP